MKQLILIFLVLVLSLQGYGQKITALPAVTSATGTSLLLIRSGASGDQLSRITKSNMLSDYATNVALGLKADTVNQEFTGTITLPTTTAIGDVSATEVQYISTVSSNVQTQLNAKLDTTNVDPIANYVPLLVDTIPLFVFGGGGGNNGDTTTFTTSTVYGSFFNAGSDTLVVTSLRATMIAGSTPLGTDTLAIQVYWNDTINVALGNSFTTINSAALGINSVTVGTVDASFANSKIPPSVHVWCKTPGVVVGRKPNMVTVQISGYKIPKY